MLLVVNISGLAPPEKRESGPRFRHSIRIAGETGPRFRHAIPTADEVKKWMKGAAGNKIYQSLVCIAVRQGGEKFSLPGTIIRSDGIVATSASLLSCLNSKELSETVDVKVLKTNATYKGVLLNADFCSNIAFVKMMSPEPQAVATFGNLDDLYPGIQAVAASCHVRHNILRYAVPSYSCGRFGSVANKIANGESHSRTSGAFIRAAVAPHVDVLGGPLIDPESGVIGVIYSCDSCCQLKATPIVDVLKNLERLEKHREQDP